MQGVSLRKQGFLEVFAFWGESGTFLLKIIICMQNGTLLGNIFFGGGGVAEFFFCGGEGKTPQNRPPGGPGKYKGRFKSAC